MKTITAGELMTRKIFSVRPSLPVDQLLQFLTDHGISGAPVVDGGGEPVGVVSLTDVARNGTVSERRNREPATYYRTLEDFVDDAELERFRVDAEPELTVEDIMTPMVFAVEEHASVQEVATMMLTGRIHRVFVKSGGQLRGVISSMDLLPLVRDM